MKIQNVLTGLYLAADTQRFTATKALALVVDGLTARLLAITYPNARIVGGAS